MPIDQDFAGCPAGHVRGKFASPPALCGSPGGAASPWTVAVTGDFNADGFSDILWYNTSSGQAVVWLVNGTSVIGGGSPPRRARGPSQTRTPIELETRP